MARHEEQTKVEGLCIERDWTLVQFDRVYIDEVFDRLMEAVSDKYWVVHSYDRGYDDPLTSKIYFQNSNDAWAFKVLIKDLLKEEGAPVGYFQFVESDDGFTQIAIVGKAFWDENGHLDDGHDLDDDTEEALPYGFYALAEGCYEHTFTFHEEAKKALIEAGFEEKIDLI